MRFAFTEQQLELRAAFHDVLARECTEGDVRAVAELGAGAGRGAPRWRALAGLGVLGLAAPEALGGLGLSDLELVGLCEEAGWSALPEPFAETAGLVVPSLAAVADSPTSAPEARHLAASSLRLITGSGAASSVGGVAPTPDGWSLTTTVGTGGEHETSHVVGAGRAALFLLACHGEEGPELHTVGAPASQVVATPSLDTTRDLGAVIWVPSASTRLASGEAATALLEGLCDRGALYTGAALAGVADRLITMTAAYAVNRQQFGRPIGSFQAVKHQLADARTRLEFTRPALYRAAWTLSQGAPGRHDTAMAKSLASDAADLAAKVALQVHGAIGYTWECDLQLWLKRAWSLSSSWGDAPTQRARVLELALAARD